MERLKWVTTFLYSSLHLCTIQDKPFTPILGETLNIRVADIDMYLENTVSKPPTINFYGISNNYKMYGFCCLHANTGPNSITVLKKGKIIVEFEDKDDKGVPVKDIYHLYIPPLLCSGITVGKRLLNYYNHLVVQSIIEGTSAVIKFNPDKRGAFASLIGLNQKTFPDYSKGFIIPSNLISINPVSLEYKITAKEKDHLVNIEGEWTDHISFNKVRYWSSEEHKIPYLQKHYNILPSDSSLRNDVKAFKEGNLDEAQKVKEEYEQIQRTDRELRKKKN